MKDIHWKSSLKMNKLMVKDYDFTSERELVIIVNIEGASNKMSNDLLIKAIQEKLGK